MGGGEHDGLFRVMVQDAGLRDALVREHLPAPVVAVLSPDPPELMEASFLDPELAASQADALLRLTTRSGDHLFVYCLVEHKSAPDRWVALQLLRYLERAWARQRADGAGALAPVLPLVVYHGEQPWPSPPHFGGLYAEPAEAARLSLDFHYTLLDVGEGDEATLSRNRHLRAMLRLLKYGTREFAHDGEALAVLVEVLRDLGAGPLFLFEVALTYVHKTWAITHPTLRAALAHAAPDLPEDHMSVARGTIYAENMQLSRQQGLQEGRRQGLQEGLQEGRQQGLREGLTEGLHQGVTQGRRDSLRVILQTRFGPLPAAMEERIASGTVEQLEGWLIAAIQASSLEAVFLTTDH